MSTTTKQDQEFLSAVLPNILLELAIEWIGANMNPEDVFAERVLRKWAEENGYEEST